MLLDEILSLETKPKEKQKETSKEGAVGIWSALLPVASWLVFLGFGSAFLAFYYTHIHYFPELRWEESFSYLAAVTVLGGGVVAIYGLLLFVPGWIWSEFLIFDSELQEGRLCYIGTGGRNEPRYSTICQRVAVPFAAFMLIVHVAILADDVLLAGATLVVGLAGLTWASIHGFSAELSQKPRKTTAEFNALLTKYVLTADIAAFSSALSLYILKGIVDPKQYSWFLLLICTVSMVISNFLVAVQFRNKPVRAIVTAILAAVTLLTFGEFSSARGFSQSERILAKFGFGTPDREVNLNFEKNGTNLGERPTGPVILLSRLGTEYLVEQRGKRYVLPKSEVHSWSITINDKEPPATLTRKESRKLADAKWEQAMAKKMSYPLGWVLLISFSGWVADREKRYRRRHRSAPKCWEAFRSGRTLVVLCNSSVQDGIELGETMALARIRTFFLQHRLQMPEVVLEAHLAPEDLYANLIILEGADRTELSKLLLATVNFKDCGDLQDDHVLIYGVPNPLHQKARALLVSCSLGHSAWAGIDYVLGKDHGEEFEIRLKAEMCQGVLRYHEIPATV